MTKDAGSGPKLPVQQLAILAVARFAEPLAYTSVNPYLPDMIRGFGVAENDIATWAGLTSAAFSLAQSVTAVPWGRAADRYGRKPVLVVGLLSTMVCFIIWGLSTSLPMAITVRAIQGGGNGNVGIIRTMVAEMVPERELQPRAFSIMPLVWSLGSVVGPAFGGFFAKPAEQYPDLFGDISFFKTFPYALPNLLATVFFLISACSATFFLKETLATKRDRTDWGLLVGQRLTRAFSRRRKQQPRGRTSSFVDGEATAPLVPSKPFPRSAKAQGSASMSEIFSYQTVIALLAYSFLAFHSVAYDQNITVFLSTPVIPRTPDNYKPPLYFNGGFGLDPGTIGTIFTIYGVTSAAVQFILYPALVARYGVLRTFHFCSIFLPIVYFITPFASLFATERARFLAIIGVMILKAFCIIIAFPSTTILLTNSCTSLRILSSLNGFATMFSALCRAMGPASTGWVFSWGADHGYVVSAYFFLGTVALLGAIPGFMIVEGDGPTAGSAALATEEDGDSSEDSSMRDSGVLLPNESAAVDSEDEGGETQPLITSQRNGGSKYRSIAG
ncbi:Major facilitator superfamily domain, general substrate transporter [Akanthomyces lecanii RCEF 1005]|uniref:Major facilitator superfamily domain, general substrate transporter n=1 Tax=Akanthomyces lecanii RCEF 1005 TaxID=1081108 RepID=A0A168KGN5_CORDF|nr:Major facilitator superfamily domain, general substrate transporter [Akanthomyces lecanii RCEF 1005]